MIPSKKEQKVLSLLDKGYRSRAKMARLIGVSRSSVYRSVKKLTEKGLFRDDGLNGNTSREDLPNLKPVLKEEGESNATERMSQNEALKAASIISSVDTQDKDRIRNLEKEVAGLKQELDLADKKRHIKQKGGVFVLRASDHHYGDSNHMLSCSESMQRKTAVLINKFKPDKIEVVAGDDWIAGRGIYKEQDLDMVVSDVNSQCALGAYKARAFLEEIRGVSNAPIRWHVMRGNHDHAQGHSMTEYLHLLMLTLCNDIPDVEFVMHWDRIILNLADKGFYNVLVRHGFGYSKNSPNSPGFIEAVKDELLAMQREMQPGEHIRRVLSGHTHWASCGIERSMGLYFDTTGGLQRNTRVKLGANQRPVGWIAYVSPSGMDSDILEPIMVAPEKGAYEREVCDPHLSLSNHQDAAECLKAFHEKMKEKGVYGPDFNFGILNTGRP